MAEESLRVLVVDDELPLREELRSFDWHTHGFELAGEASNGAEALAFCRRHRPDVIITDITMPVMDGLQLIRILRTELPHTQIILLTCHSEFEFAKEAIAIGAIDYLLKVTMEAAELISALNRAKAAALRERSHRRNEREELRLRLSCELLHFTQGEPGYGDKKFGTFLKEALQCSLPFRLISLHAETPPQIRFILKREVEQRLERLEGEHSFTWLPVKEGVYLLFIPHAERMNPKELGIWLEKVLRELKHDIMGQLSFLCGEADLYAVVGPLIHRTDDFTVSCRFASSRHPLRFYLPESDVLLGETETVPTSAETAAAEMAARLHIIKDDPGKLTEWIRKDFRTWAEDGRFHPDLLKGWVNEWRREWLREERNWIAFSRRTRTVAERRTLDELIAVLIHEVETSRNNQRRIRTEVEEAMRYMNDHLASPITLAVVAEQVGLSPHHLCRIFPEETGISFHDYLKHQRMEQAAHLLRHTSLRVYEVAHRVGISSYRYFTAMFRDYAGVTPRDFKKNA